MLNAATMQELVAELMRARDLADAAESNFMKLLVEAESRTDLWGVGKYKKFEMFLSGENICTVSRFNTGKAMLSKFGDTVCSTIGIANAATIDKLPEQSQCKAVEMLTQYKKENGAIPSKQTTRELLKPMGLISNPIPKNFRKESFDYVAECDRLRLRVAELEAENASLRAQLAKFAKGPTKARHKQNDACVEQA